MVNMNAEHEEPMSEVEATDDRTAFGVWDSSIAEAFHALEELPDEGLTFDEAAHLISSLSRLRSRVDAATCNLTGVLRTERPDVDAAMVLRSRSGMTGREARKRTRVAEQLVDMPNTARALADGDITFEHAVRLAYAAEDCGAAAVDGTPGLLTIASEVPADRFGRNIRHWAQIQMAEQGVNTLERQERGRTGSKFTDRATGNRVFHFRLDPKRASLVERALDSRYNHLRRADTADGQGADEVRSPTQRLADAFFEAMTGRDAFTLDSLGGVGAGLTPAVQLILVSHIGVVDGTDPHGINEIIGVGPVPPSILGELSPDTELAAMIFGGNGRALWLGRKQRLANAPQRLAVAVRDRGCFECGAPMHQCQLHHVDEWRRDRGATDVDNLVAVCRAHHKWIIDNNLKVHRTPDGWQTRPRDGPGADTS